MMVSIDALCQIKTIIELKSYFCLPWKGRVLESILVRFKILCYDLFIILKKSITDNDKSLNLLNLQ